MGRGRSSSGRGSSSSSRGGSSSSYRGGSSSSSRSSYSSGYHSSRHYSGGSGKGSAIAVAIMLIFFGALLLIMGVDGIAKNNQYGAVIGTCVKNEYYNGWYYTTYTYVVKGQNYESRSSEGWELEEHIGAQVKIYYLKSSPSEITEVLPVNKTGNTIIMVLGTGFVAIAVIIIVAKRKKKISQEPKVAQQTTLPVQPTQPKYVNCSYCGTKLRSDATSCRNCGANVK